MAKQVSIVQSRYVLRLDDKPALIADVAGGHVRADVVTTSMGPQKLPLKHLSTLRFEPFTIEVGMAMGAPIRDWIEGCVNLAPVRKDGSLIAVGIDNKAKSYRHFRGALIEEVTIPSLDASSTDAGFLSFTFQSGAITYAKGDNAVVTGIVNVAQKKWLVSNFRLTLGGLPCSRVSTVDAITIKQLTKDATDRSTGTKEPAGVEFPNMRITFAAVDAGPWEDWFDDFVVKGNNGQDKELQGSLELLAPNLTDVLARIELSHAGIFALAPDRPVGGDAIARFVAELYVEQMSFDLKG
jgi:hypothetical protein